MREVNESFIAPVSLVNEADEDKRLFYITILNFRCVCDLCSEDEQIRALMLLYRRLLTSGISRKFIRILSRDTLLVDSGFIPAASWARKREFLVSTVYGTAIKLDDVNIVLSLELGCVQRDEPSIAALNAGGCSKSIYAWGPNLSRGRGAQGIYKKRADQTAKTFYSSPFRPRLKKMPVAFVQEPDLVLFDEILLNSTGVTKTDALIDSLEISGTMAYFEYYLFSEAVALLRLDRLSRVSVNLSITNFYLNLFWEYVLDVLRGEPELAGRLYLEITETQPLLVAKQKGGAKELVCRLREVGCHLALDDFGTGFSSFEYVEFFEPEIIKLNKNSLHVARKNYQSWSAFSSMVQYCMKVCGNCVVEGVENYEDLILVKRAGANLMQGFYLDKLGRGLF